MAVLLVCAMAYGATWNAWDRWKTNRYLGAVSDARGQELDPYTQAAFLELRDKACKAMRDNHLTQSSDVARQLAINTGLSLNDAQAFAAGFEAGHGCIG